MPLYNSLSSGSFNILAFIASVLLLLWGYRAFKKFHSIVSLRRAIMTDDIIFLRGLGSNLQFFEGAWPNHFLAIIHSRQSNPPIRMKYLYNPFIISNIKWRNNCSIGLDIWSPVKYTILFLSGYNIDGVIAVMNDSHIRHLSDLLKRVNAKDIEKTKKVLNSFFEEFFPEHVLLVADCKSSKGGSTSHELSASAILAHYSSPSPSPPASASYMDHLQRVALASDSSPPTEVSYSLTPRGRRAVYGLQENGINRGSSGGTSEEARPRLHFACLLVPVVRIPLVADVKRISGKSDVTSVNVQSSRELDSVDSEEKMDVDRSGSVLASRTTSFTQMEWGEGVGLGGGLATGEGGGDEDERRSSFGGLRRLSDAIQSRQNQVNMEFALYCLAPPGQGLEPSSALDGDSGLARTGHVLSTAVFTADEKFSVQDVYGVSKSGPFAQSDGESGYGGGGGGGESSDSAEAECVVCLVERKDVCLLPCRHLCVCQHCFPHVDKCPVCRTKFESYIIVDHEELMSLSLSLSMPTLAP